jgi:AraC-like DNA-binding protein
MKDRRSSHFSNHRSLRSQRLATLRPSGPLIPRHKGVVKSLIYIADNLNRPIWIKDLVSVSTLSRRGLFKAFKKHTGRTPGEELEIARIEQSKAILAEGTHEMKDLAKICGYRSVNTFYVAFKRVVGTSPRKFQQQYSR